MKTKKQLFWVFVILILAGVTSCKNVERLNQPKAVKGILDLSSWNFTDNGSIPLSGEWSFNWHEFIIPGAGDLPSTEFIDVPGIWNGFEYEDIILDNNGWATYVLKVILPDEAVGKQLGFFIDYMYTAYSIWINGDNLVGNGIVGTSRDTMTPQYLPERVSFVSDQKEIILTVHVSNFYHRKGGMPEPIILGFYETVQKSWEKKILYDTVLISALLIMGIYHTFLYAYRKSDRAPMFFALYCFSIAFRTLFIGSRLIYFFFPGFPWQVGIRLDYLSIFLTFPLFIFFVKTVFTKEMLPWVTGIVGIISLVFGALVIVLPSHIFTHLLKYYEIIILLAGLAVFTIVLKAVRNRREGAAVLLVGVILFFLTAVNDVLHNNEIIQTVYLSNLGLLLFTFSQIILLAFRYDKAFETIENINRSLWRFVPKEFLDSLGREDIITVELGDQVSRKITVLFSDIRNFTTISEQMTPVENFTFINTILERIGPIIRKNNGFIDKYIGDAVMALFLGEPDNAVNAAVEMQKALQELNEDFGRKGFPEVRIGIGINSGNSMLGIVGEQKRLESTVISDAVNVASRLEGLTKIYGSTIIISGDVADSLSDGKFLMRSLGTSRVKGRGESVRIFEVFNTDDEVLKTLKISTQGKLQEAVEILESGEPEKAEAILRGIDNRNHPDAAVEYFLKVCREDKQI